jgi:hypothetical protein
MLPRLWQCADARWWEPWTSLPVSIWGVTGLVAIAAVLLLAKRRYAEEAMNVARNLAGATLTLTFAGLAGGLLLRLLGPNPSWCYRAASLAWLAVGWPLLAASIWHVRRWPPTASHRLSRRVVFGLIGASCFALLLFKFAFIGHGPMTQLARIATTYVFDGVTPLFSTDECLAEHRLQYLSRRPDPNLDAARFPGYVIELELDARSKHVDRGVYARALHSYRVKVRRGELLEPETLDAAACPGCPGVEQELRAWIADEGHTEASRELARLALSGTLYPPEAPRRHRGRPNPDRMLRYPSRPP